MHGPAPPYLGQFGYVRNPLNSLAPTITTSLYPLYGTPALLLPSPTPMFLTLVPVPLSAPLKLLQNARSTVTQLTLRRLIPLRLSLTEVANPMPITPGKRLPKSPMIVLLSLAGPSRPRLWIIHLCEATADITDVHASGSLMFALLSTPTSEFLAQCVGGRAKRRPLSTLPSPNVLFVPTLGSPFLLLLLLAVVLQRCAQLLK